MVDINSACSGPRTHYTDSKYHGCRASLLIRLPTLDRIKKALVNAKATYISLIISNMPAYRRLVSE